MKTLVCSDIHDHLGNFKSVMEAAKAADCNSMIICGDLCSPFVIDLIHRNWNGPVHIVYGNNDGDKMNIYKKAEQANGDRSPNAAISIHGEYLTSRQGHSLDGIPNHISLAAYHYPEPALSIAESGLYKCVFYGHTHRPELNKIGDCLIANPGSVMGWAPGEENTRPSFLIVNWENGEADLVHL